MSIGICSSDEQVRYEIDLFLATESKGMYTKWALEVARREFANLETEMLAKPGNSLARNTWICALGWAKDSLRYANMCDDFVAMEHKWLSEENKNDKYYYFFTTFDEHEQQRNNALQAAEQEFKRTSDQAVFDAAVAAAEEAYYVAASK